MAQNVSKILEIEESLGRKRVFISGHNGHIAKKGTFYTTMGNHLKDQYNQMYYPIGTDYYKTNCNINEMGESTDRGNHKFCSADPLAEKAKEFEGQYCLEFDEIDNSGETYQMVHKPMRMGSLGEGYQFLMKVIRHSVLLRVLKKNGMEWYTDISHILFMSRLMPMNAISFGGV